MYHLIQCRPASIDTDKSLDTRCRGKQISYSLPKRRNRFFRPRNAGDEYQDHRCKDKHQHRRLAGRHKTGQRHSKEDRGKQVRQNEQQDRNRIAHLRQGEEFRHNSQYPDADNHINQDIGQRLAKHDTQGSAKMPADRDKAMKTILLACRPPQHPDP